MAGNPFYTLSIKKEFSQNAMVCKVFLFIFPEQWDMEIECTMGTSHSLQ
jgi:hypothetical protein